MARSTASPVQGQRERPEGGDTDRNKERRPDLVLFGVAVVGFGLGAHNDGNGVKQDDACAESGNGVSENKKGIPKHGGFLGKVLQRYPKHREGPASPGHGASRLI
jgi:hypothetical protein